MNNNDDKYSVHEIPMDREEKRQKEQDAIVENLLKNASKNEQQPKEKNKSSGVVKTLAGITATAVIGGAVAMWALNKEDEPDYHTINFMYNIEEEAGESKNVVIGIKVGDVLPKNIRGYRFMGWYKDDTFTEAYNDDDIVPYNATLYGKYMKILTVNFPESTDGYYITIGENKEPVLGENYTFSIFVAESHSKSSPKVYVNLLNDDTQEPLELLPDDNGVYTIEDMQGDYNINIEGVAVNTYRVVFKVGTEIISEGIINHGEYPEGLKPSDTDSRIVKEHQTFLGWGLTTASEDSEVIENVGEYRIVGDTVFHAKYEHTVYDVKFIMSIDGTDIEMSDYSLSVKSGQTIPDSFAIPVADKYPASDSKYYYDFKGWSLKKDGTIDDIITDFTSIEITSNTNFYAVYSQEVHKYTLNFVVDNYLDVSVIVNRDGQELTLTPNSSAEDLYLCYGDTFEINCTAQEGHNVGSVLVDGGATKNEDGEYECNGYGSITITVSEEVVECTVIFMNEGNEYDRVKVNYGHTASLSKANPTKSDTNAINYEFAYWSLSENGEKFDLESETITSTTLTLYAVYTQEYYEYSLNITWNDFVDTIITVYRDDDTITFTKDTPEDDLYFHYGDLFSIENTAHTGYTFDEMTITGASKLGDTTYKVSTDVVYVTISAHINEYSVTFVNGEDTYYTDTLVYGSKVTIPTTSPTKDTDSAYIYTFSYWAIQDGEDFVEVDFESYTIENDVVFYAVYSQTNVEYTVSFNMSNVINSFEIKLYRSGNVIQTITSNQSLTVYYGDQIDISYEAQDGYTINIYGDGIRKDSGRYLVDGSTLTPTINISSEIITCAVTFYDYDGTTILQSSNVDYGTIVTPPTNPTKTADNIYTYTFSHWSYELNGDSVPNFEIVSTSVKYYAVYNVEYVEFNLNVTYATHISTIIKINRDGVITGYTNQEIIKIRPNDEIIIENTPYSGYKDSYVITGNYREENSSYYVNNSGDVTIVILEEALPFTVTFMVNNEQFDVQSIIVGEKAVLPQNPPNYYDNDKMIEYGFTHWSLTEGGNYVDVSNVVIVSDTTYYAVFDQVNQNVTLNIGGTEYGVYMEEGNTVYSEVERLVANGIIPEVNDMNSCGWFSDSSLTLSIEDDAVVETGMSLYTRMATLDKISISNAQVSVLNDATSIIIPRKDSDGNLITEIAESGFAECSELWEIVLSSSIQKINKKAFYHARLTYVNIPSTVDLIGANTFTYIDDNTGSSLCASFGDPYGWYAGDTAVNYQDIDTNIVGGHTLSVTYDDVDWNKLSENQTILTLDIDGESTYCIIEKGTNVINTIESLNLVVDGVEISDSTTCGWFSDENFVNGFNDESVIVSTPLTLYTKLATLDKLKFTTIENAIDASGNSWTQYRVAASSTSIEGEVVVPKKTEEGNYINALSMNAFSGCTTMTSIILPSTIIEIQTGSFNNSGVTNLVIPESVSIIYFNAFSNSNITSMIISERNTSYCLQENVLFDINKTTLLWYPKDKADSSYIVPSSVTSIQAYAFAFNDNITKITLPNGLKGIYDSTFMNCYSLTEINIPSTITSIGSGAFLNCSKLQSVTFESNSQLTTIGNNAFACCALLSEITLPSSVVLIEHEAFTDVTNVYFEDSSSWEIYEYNEETEEYDILSLTLTVEQVANSELMADYLCNTYNNAEFRKKSE